MTALNPPPPASPRPPRPWLKPAVIVLVAAGALGWWYWSRPADGGTQTEAKADGDKAGKAGRRGERGRFGADPNRAQPVAAAEARIGDIDIAQTALGTVTALRTVTVKPRVDGLLQSVAFTEGQAVKQGDVLAQIDPEPLRVQLAQVEGQLARDTAQLNNARIDLERYRTLLAQDSIASQQVDQQAAQVRQLEGTVKVGQAQVENARLQLSYTRITAPIGGRLGLRLVDAGNMVRASDPNGIAVITQVDPITAVFTIPQDVLPRVLDRLDAGERPAVQAWDREQKNLLARGQLITVDNQIDVATGTVKLKAQFPNSSGKLFPNQFVNVRMVVDVRKGAVVVPSAAVQRGAQATVAFVVRDDGTVELRPVQAGPTEGNFTAIESGLRAGERVVTDGVDRIREGSKVEVTVPGAGLAGPARTPSGEGAGPAGKADPAKREEFRKRLEGMTPEQREALKKRREERRKARESQAAQ